VITASFYVKTARKRAEKECEKRMQAYIDGLHEGEQVKKL